MVNQNELSIILTNSQKFENTIITSKSYQKIQKCIHEQKNRLLQEQTKNITLESKIILSERKLKENEKYLKNIKFNINKKIQKFDQSNNDVEKYLDQLDQIKVSMRKKLWSK